MNTQEEEVLVSTTNIARNDGALKLLSRQDMTEDMWEMPAGGLELATVLPDISLENEVSCGRVKRKKKLVEEPSRWGTRKVKGAVKQKRIREHTKSPVVMSPRSEIIEKKKTLPPLNPSDRDEGFDNLQKVLNRTLSESAARHVSLSEAWDAVASWLERFGNEIAVGQMLVAVDELFQEAINKTEFQTQPSNTRSHATFVALDNVFTALLQYLPGSVGILQSIRTNLYSMVYLTIPPPPFPLDSLYTTHSKDASNDVLAHYYQAKTFPQACKMLSKSLRRQGVNLETAESTKTRTADALERVTRYWKMHVTGILFKAWRAVSQNSIKENNYDNNLKVLERKLAAAEYQRDVAVQSATDAQEALEIKDTTLRDQIEAQTMNLISERDEKKKLKETIGMMVKRQESDGQAAIRTALESEIRFKKVAGALSALQTTLNGSEFEERQREQFSYLAEKECIDTTDLLDWINRMIQKTFMFNKIYEIQDFCSGGRSVYTYWLVLAAMSPKHVPREVIRKNLAEIDRGKVGLSLLEKARDMGITTHVTVDELLSEGSGEQHEVFVSNLFSRFCGATPSSVPFGPSAEDTENDPTTTTTNTGEENILESIETATRKGKAWTQIANKVQKNVWTKVTTVMKTGVSGSMNAVETKDFPIYTELTTDCSVIIDDKDEEQTIKEFLVKNFKKLRRVFRYYAVGRHESTADATMSEDEFWRLISDAKVLDKSFTRNDLRRIFDASNTQSMDKTLDPDEWVTALVRIGSWKFRNKSETTGERIILLLEKHILMYCCGGESDEFKTAIYAPAVQDSIKRHKIKLKKTFKHYISKINDSELTFSDFTTFVRELSAYDSICTMAAVEQMHLSLHGDSSDGNGLLYHEFTESLCGLSVFKYPAPFIPLHMKLERFIDNWLTPLIGKKIR